MAEPELVLTEALLAIARPPLGDLAKRWKAPKEAIGRLRNGLERCSGELRPIQEWVIDALSSRAKLEAPLGPEAVRRLRALFLVRPVEHRDVLARVVAEAHGLLPIFAALLGVPELGLIAQRKPPSDTWIEQKKVLAGSEIDRQWLEGGPKEAYSAIWGEGIALEPEFGAWVEALRPLLERASANERAECKALVEAARATLALEQRAALAYAFDDIVWSEEDAALALADSSTSQRITKWLLPRVEQRETFEALAARAGTTLLFGSSVYAEIAARGPTDRAAERLAFLLRKPVEVEAVSNVIQIVEVLACFRHEIAAAAIASAARFAKGEAKAYFTKHPQFRPLLEAEAKGRGKRPAEIRDLLLEMDRQSQISAALPADALPHCIAEPPWTTRPEPWQARELATLVDGERVVETDVLERMRTQMKAGERGRAPAHDQKVLAGKGMLDTAKYGELTDEAALENVGRLSAVSLGCAIARFGTRALPGVAAVMNEKPMQAHALVLAMIRTPRVAVVASSFHRDDAWLKDDPALAALGLVPALFGADLDQRYGAELALLRLCAFGHRALVLDAARRYGDEMGDEVAAILDRDPMYRLPPTLPTLHEKLEDGSLPVLCTPEGPLPASSNRTVGLFLAVSEPWRPHPALAELRARCTQESREAFAWEVYTKTGNLDVIASLGGDDCVRRLDQQLSAAQNKMHPTRIHHAYDVLARVGTPLAHVLLLKHALLSPWRDRNERITGHLHAVARARGVSLAEVEESVFPTLGVGHEGIVLDYGPRAFRVALDDHLVPWLEHVEGGRVEKLPRPTKKDDAAKAASALARFQALNLDLDDVRQAILTWFERAMATERTWQPARFRTAVVAHPLLMQVARRLLWQVGDKPVRLSEDGTFADDEDHAVPVHDGDAISILHPIRLSPESRARFQQLLLDYAIMQPFEQLERATFRLEDSERALTELSRFSGDVVATARRNDLLGASGWQYGPGNHMHKPLRRHVVELEVAKTSVHAHGTTAADRLGVVRLTSGAPLSELSDVEASELLRDVARLPRV